MKCSLCGFNFDENEAETACKECFLAKNCKLIKCPNCGYEMPPEPAWLNKILRRRKADGTCRQD
jgi:rubredoxin